MIRRRVQHVYGNEASVCVSWPLIRNKLPHFRHHWPDSGIIQQKPNSANEVIPIIAMEEKMISDYIRTTSIKVKAPNVKVERLLIEGVVFCKLVHAT